MGGLQIPMEQVLALAGILFSFGLFGLMLRRNIIFMLMSLEVMLNASALAFVAAGAKWGQASLSAKPRDFTSTLSQTELTRDRMIVSVTNGRPGTPMPGFASQLSPQQIEGIVDYVRARFMIDAGDAGIAADGSYHERPFPNDLAGRFERGSALYYANCAECHGTAGDGNGRRAYFIFPKPRNFLDPATQQIFNRPRLYSGIADGVIGKEMPAWSKVFSEQDIADVAEFVYREFITATSAD